MYMYMAIYGGSKSTYMYISLHVNVHVKDNYTCTGKTADEIKGLLHPQLRVTEGKATLGIIIFQRNITFQNDIMTLV